MANDINVCTFTGRLGRDCEVKYMSNGEAVANFAIAVGEAWKNKEGEKVENTEWVRCTAYRQLGEICGEWLKKGQQVAVVGKMKTRKWTDKDGQERYTTEVILERMTMLGGKPAEGDAPRQERPARSNDAPRETQAAKTAGYDGKGGFDDMEDDLPF